MEAIHANFKASFPKSYLLPINSQSVSGAVVPDIWASYISETAAISSKIHCFQTEAQPINQTVLPSDKPSKANKPSSLSSPKSSFKEMPASSSMGTNENESLTLSPINFSSKFTRDDLTSPLNYYSPDVENLHGIFI